MNQIGDYGVIGDCHSLALVGRDGSIDWCCFPRFDSPSVLTRVLDEDTGGRFVIAPTEPVRSVERSYLPATNVLATRFRTSSGVLEVTDCMPVAPFDPTDPAAVSTRHSILRRVRCLEGTVTAEVHLDPRPEYGVVRPRFTRTSEASWSIVGGPGRR
ncbi:MAG: trehalase-like domain-containing protein [Actinomycetota bacterium]